jgi:GxxExxY protein
LRQSDRGPITPQTGVEQIRPVNETETTSTHPAASQPGSIALDVATPDITPNADLTFRIIGFAMRVHRRLGPGLLESIYERCLSHELDRAEIPHICQAPLSVNYDGVDLPCAYRADIIVHHKVVLEIKSVDRLGPLHEAQLLT